MRIEFECKTNKPYVMINTLQCRTDKGMLTIDRDETEYTIEDDGTMSMTWNGCYLWDGEDIHYLSKCKAKELVQAIQSVEFELEDDADDDYTVEMEAYRWRY